MNVFVVGATGVIGRRVIPRLIERGHRVTATGRSGAKRADLAKAGATPVAIDLFDARSTAVEMAGHDAVINLATHMPSSSTRMLWRRSWRENDHLRREGAAALVDAALAAGVSRFVQESFAPMYADRGDEWLDERSLLEPSSDNRSALEAERSVQRFTRQGGTGVALRFGFLYGTDSMLTPELIGWIRRGWFGMPGPADAFISSVNHDDAASAVAAALHGRAGVYNVVDDEPLTRRAYANALAAAFRAKAPRLVPAWMSNMGGSMARLLSRSQRISNRALRDETEWAPAFASVREGWIAIADELARRVI